MINNLSLKKVFFVITSILALLASIIGVFNMDIYSSVVVAKIIPGVFTQDLLVIVASILLLILSLNLKENSIKKLIIIHGILGFFLYAYGIYAIEQVYTFLYPLYLIILSLSFYSLSYSLCNIKSDKLDKIKQLKIISIISSVYGIFIAIMFNFIWLSMLIDLIINSYRIEYTFSVFIIDLVFVMPALFIAAVMTLRNKAFGIINLSSLFILSFFILFPLALGEIIKPAVFNVNSNIGELSLYLALSVSFIIFAILGLSYISVELEKDECLKK